MNQARTRIRAIGMVNALGDGIEAILPRLLSGDISGIRPLSDYLPDRPALLGECRGELPEVPALVSDLASRNTQLLYSAFRQIEAAVLESRARFGPGRIGVILGSSTTGIAEAERALRARNLGQLRPEGYRYRQQEMGAVSEVVARLAGISGPAYTVSTACSSSAKVFRAGKQLLELGLCDAVIVGGSDCLCRLTVQGFAALDLISSVHTNPLSKNRRGINIGEGACLMLLTHEAGGVQVLGVGEASDAFHISSPDPEAKGAIAALTHALARAEIDPAEVDYVNLHGTGTLHNDAMEARAVRAVFPEKVWASSTKPLVGHTLGASGATEVGFCAMALQQLLQEGATELPPHVYDGEFDDSLPALALVSPGCRIKRRARNVMISNSFGFGGSNCAVVLGISEA